MALRDAFVLALSEAVRPRAEGLDDAVLAELVERARAAWPGLAVSDETLVAYVAARLPEDTPLATALARVSAPDLLLCCACVAREPAALAAFDALLSHEVEVATQQIRGTRPDPDDLKQQLRQRLLVGDERGPQIGAYSGRGDVRAWLRITAARDAMHAKRRLDRSVPLEDAVALGGVTGDPEIERFKARYRDEFRTCLQAALRGLSSEDRNLLRQHFIHGLSIDQLGALHRVHRATAARWIIRVRQRLVEDTRARLLALLRVGDDELESVLRLIRSELDISIQGALATAGDDAP